MYPERKTASKSLAASITLVLLGCIAARLFAVFESILFFYLLSIFFLQMAYFFYQHRINRAYYEDQAKRRSVLQEIEAREYERTHPKPAFEEAQAEDHSEPQQICPYCKTPTTTKDFCRHCANNDIYPFSSPWNSMTSD